MRKVIQGFYEGEKFIRISEYLTKGSLLIIADVESGKYFIGSEEDDYVPKYTNYQICEPKGLIIAFKKETLCDVFSYKGRKVLHNYSLVSSPTNDNDFFTFRSAEDETRIVDILKDAEDLSVRAAKGLEVRQINGQKMLFNGRTCICSCDGWQFSDIRQMNEGYYLVASNCQKQGLFFFKKASDGSYVNILDCEIEDLRDAKILPIKYDAVYWDKKLRSFVAENENLKSLVTEEGKIIKNSTACKIVSICEDECYACYQQDGSLSIVKSDGQELLSSGFYKLCIPHEYTSFDYSNWYFIDDTYKYEHVKILLVKDIENDCIVKIVWGHPKYRGKYELKISGPISWVEYIDKDYLYLMRDSKKFLFYQDSFLGSYPKSAQITKDFSKGIDPEITVSVEKTRKTFYLGLLASTETDEDEVKPKPYIPTEKEVSYALGNLYAEILLGIDANPHKPPEFDN